MRHVAADPHVGRAISAFVDRELDIVAGIKRGLADVAAGRTISHEAAVAEINAVLNTAKKRAARGKRS